MGKSTDYFFINRFIFNTHCVEKKQLKCEQKPFFPTAGNQTYII